MYDALFFAPVSRDATHMPPTCNGGPMKPVNRIYVHLATNDPSRCTCSRPVDSGRRYLGHYACVLCGLLIERLIG